MSSNFAASTKLKVSQLYAQSFVRLQDRRNMLFIGHKTGVHLYDIGTGKIQQVKLDKAQYSGPFSCFTVSDQLVFFCCGSKVLAMGNNLKIIFEADTNLAVDKIDSIHVHGYRMFLVSQNMVNELLIGGVQIMNKKSRITQSPQQKIQDVQEQVFDAKITHSLLITISAEKPFLLLLKSSNQIETFEKKQAQATFTTSSPPIYACRYPQNQENQNKVLVGTASGQILYLQVNRKSIKKLWSINETRGKINTICELKNGFFVARDKVIQFWSKNKQMLKEQPVQQKTICSYYLPTQQLLIYGTTAGTVTQMQNYEKYIKQSKRLNEAKQKQQIIKEIQLLRYKKRITQQKIVEKKNAKQQQAPVTTLKKINVKSSVSIDYVNLCYNIQVQSEEKVFKIVCQGPVTLVDQKQNVFFEGQLQQGKIKVYILRFEHQNNIQLKVKYPEVFNELEKLNLLIYFSYESRVQNLEIDLKQLSLHQKVQIKSFNLKNPNLNKLEISGNFKFQMKMWMNCIFNEFSSEQFEEFQAACYESVITKNKILVRFRPGLCILLSESTIPLVIIKKKLLQKSKEKGMSLSYQTVSSPQSIKSFISKIQPQMKSFLQTKRKYQLLPGLLQLKNDLSLESNQELLKILQDREAITNKFKENSRLQTQMKQKILDFYRSYRQLAGKSVVEFEEKTIATAVEKWDTKTIVSTIYSS